MINLYVDGSCEPINPGGRGIAGAVLEIDGVAQCASKALGQHAEMTNNLAEYEGFRLGLELCLANNITGGLTIHSDSMLVVNQVNGKWKIKDGKLYTNTAREVINFYKSSFDLQNTTVQWIPGKENPADGPSRDQAAAEAAV